MAQTTAIQRITGRIREFFTAASENTISRVRSITRRWRSSWRQPSNDWARSDYAFWLRAYYARASGLELSGLFIKPLVSKVSAWTLGRAPKWKLDNETAQQALADWWADVHPDVLRAWRGALKQADAFVVVNADLTLTLLPPDCVDPIVADDDYSLITGWRVTQVLAHPDTTQKMTVIDEYYADRRIHRVEVDGVPRSIITYPNLLGRLTIVHIANQADTGETFGHAEAEALLPLLHRYGEIFDAAIEGNILQGRPTPTLGFATVQDLEKFDEENASTESETLSNGTTRQVKTYEVDLSQLLVYSGAEFEYKSPGSFTGDTAKLLELMFYLILQHSELPEFVFGNAISSSQASASTQMPIFIEFVKMRRGEMVGWLTELAEIALGYLALTTPGVSAEMEPTLQWEQLDQQDGSLTLETIKWAFLEGLIDKLTALKLMPVEVEDPEGVLETAQAEQIGDAAAFPENADGEAQFGSDLTNAIGQAGAGDQAPVNLDSTAGLNGIQVRTAIDLLKEVADGQVAPSIAVQLLVSLGIAPEAAQRMVEAAQSFKARKLPSDTSQPFKPTGVPGIPVNGR